MSVLHIHHKGRDRLGSDTGVESVRVESFMNHFIVEASVSFANVQKLTYVASSRKRKGKLRQIF